MCINPAELPNGTKFGCRKCWQCREVKIQDWTGRCIAESRMGRKTFSVTLTYGGGDHERAAVLTYSDVQKYFKRLRKAGYDFKYLVAGEYGSTKGRAHWHAILFFLGEAPPHELKRNFADKFWHHGHVWWEEPTPKAVRYVCKYIQKDQEDAEWQGHFAMSKKPPIGHEFFLQRADDYAKNGLSPQDLRYEFTENRDKDGKPVRHMMHGAIARDFCARFIETWAKLHPGKWWPTSDLIDDFHESLGQQSPMLHLDTVRRGIKPMWTPRRGAEIKFSESANSFYCDVDNTRHWWRTNQGEWAWQSETGPADRLDPQSHELDPHLQAFRERKRAEQASATLDETTTHRPFASGRTSLPARTRYRSIKFVGEPLRPR